MRINFDFGDLEAFLSVKETGSFHLAAERLHLSQSAVTRRVQKLESVLDSVLFERTTRAVRPTLAAKRLQARAEAILDDAHETTLAMRDESVALAHQSNAVITVAVLPTVIAGLLPPAIQLFRDKGHRARIRVLDFAANEVAEAVAQGDADFGLGSIPALEASTHFEPLFDDRIMLTLPPDHALCARGAVEWPELEDEALILPVRGTGNRLLIDEAMARARLPLTWTYEVHRSTTALELVVGGSGIALLPQSALNSALAARIVSRPVAVPEIARPVGLLTRVKQRDSPVAAAFQDAIRQTVSVRP